MLRAGRQVNEVGSRKRFVPTSYTAEEIHEAMQDVGKAFVIEKIEWDSKTNEAVVHLKPSNGVAWEFDLVPSR